MQKARILIIDPNPAAVQSLREPLIKLGYEINSAADFQDTRFLREPNAPHLVVVDVVDPNTGIEAVQLIRRDSQVPVILTATGWQPDDRFACIEGGADECLVKPYDHRELVARVTSLLRRAPAANPMGVPENGVREWRFKGLVIQSNRRRIMLDTQPVELTTAEFDLLKLLVANSPQPLSREVILDRLRGVEWEAVDRSVDILVSRLRDKLKDDPRRPRFIRTVRSIGYQFVGELEA